MSGIDNQLEVHQQAGDVPGLQGGIARPGDRFESPPGSHLPFIALGFRGVVLISDPSFGGEEPPESEILLVPDLVVRNSVAAPSRRWMKR